MTVSQHLNTPRLPCRFFSPILSGCLALIVSPLLAASCPKTVN
ncbi:Uncharacterized protein {ECO:0000313/EMBL:CCF08117.1} [Pantoea ananatis]|nr:Uncharacterized protein {ECO:0000313/EMBL:CCF08117.1} [Pantoea ananatis]